MPYKGNLEERRARRRAYYRANRENMLAIQRRYFEAHREEILEKKRDHHCANREEILARNRIDHAMNPEKRRTWDRQRYQRDHEKRLLAAKDYHWANREKISTRKRSRYAADEELRLEQALYNQAYREVYGDEINRKIRIKRAANPEPVRQKEHEAKKRREIRLMAASTQRLLDNPEMLASCPWVDQGILT